MTNPFATSRKLAEAGIPPDQSAAIAEAVVDHTEKTAATKLDLFKLKAELEAAIARLEKKVDANYADHNAEIKSLKNSNRFNSALLIALFVTVIAPYFS
jgi:hypothetical protein